MQDIQESINVVSNFISQYNVNLSPELRFLDIVSEWSELFSCYLAQDICKQAVFDETGDLYFSILSLIIEHNIDIVNTRLTENISFSDDSVKKLGLLAKQILTCSNYGSKKIYLNSNEIKSSLMSFILMLNKISDKYNFEIKQSLQSAIKKYEQRFAKSGFIGSGYVN